MPFVNELIPDEQMDLFPFPVHIDCSGDKPTLWKWSIDREQNTYLVCTKTEGGAYEGTPKTKHYALSWNEKVTFFAGESSIATKADCGKTLTWHLHDLKVPAELANHHTRVLQLIKDSLDAMGDIYRSDRVDAVEVMLDGKHIK